MTRRGVPSVKNAWSGGAALSHPEIVEQVHVDYIASGANLIISNTFATHRGVLRDAEVVEDFEALNRQAVELAIAARDASDSSVVVAGGMSHWSFTGDDPPLDQLERDATEQAAILAAGGAEVIILEMMIDIERMLCVYRAAHRTGLPIWVGLTVGDEDGVLADPAVMTLFDRSELLVDAVAALDGLDVDVVSIMHTDVRLVDACLDIIFDNWDGPVGAYAHDVNINHSLDDVMSPAAYAALSAGWLDRGVRIIGGCCGTRPDHMHEVANLPGVT